MPHTVRKYRAVLCRLIIHQTHVSLMHIYSVQLKEVQLIFKSSFDCIDKTVTRLAMQRKWSSSIFIQPQLSGKALVSKKMTTRLKTNRTPTTTLTATRHTAKWAHKLLATCAVSSPKPLAQLTEFKRESGGDEI